MEDADEFLVVCLSEAEIFTSSLQWRNNSRWFCRPVIVVCDLYVVVCRSVTLCLQSGKQSFCSILWTGHPPNFSESFKSLAFFVYCDGAGGRGYFSAAHNAPGAGISHKWESGWLWRSQNLSKLNWVTFLSHFPSVWLWSLLAETN